MSVVSDGGSLLTIRMPVISRTGSFGSDADFGEKIKGLVYLPNVVAWPYGEGRCEIQLGNVVLEAGTGEVAHSRMSKVHVASGSTIIAEGCWVTFGGVTFRGIVRFFGGGAALTQGRLKRRDAEISVPEATAPTCPSVTLTAALPLAPDLTMTFAAISPGAFRMGSWRYGEVCEMPIREVNVTRPFELQRTEVTQAQWQAVMGANPSKFKECGPTCPVENVSWEEVQQFIKRLNDRRDGYVYRLPTEAEWEYASRACGIGDYGGDEVVGDLAWYVGNGNQSPHPVAQKKPNPVGLFDMHGNIQEWVSDWYSLYPRGPSTDPSGPETGEGHVVRGGNYASSDRNIRSAFRDWQRGASEHTGFRLARSK